MAENMHADSLINVLNTKNLSNKEQLDIYKKICDAYLHNDIEKLTKYSENGLQLAQKANNKVMTADFYMYYAYSFELYGKSDSAIYYYEKGLELAIETKNQVCEASIYGHLGNIYQRNRQYNANELSLEYYMKSLHLFESIGNKQNIVLALSNLCAYHYSMRNSERYYYYAQQANKIVETIDYDYGKMCIYYYFGENYNDYDNDEDKSINDTAFYYQSKALDIALKLGDKQWKVLILNALTYHYCLAKGEISKAEKYGLEALRVAEEYGAPRFFIASWTALSYVYLYQKRFVECRDILLKCWETDSINLQLSTLTNLAAAYLYLGEFEKAHDFFVDYVWIIESNSGIQFQKAVADMETKYETMKKEMQIAALKKDKQHFQRIIVIGVIIIILIIVAFAMSLLFIRQRHRLKEEEQKNIASDKERERIARDLHDGLGGLLSAVRINLENAEYLESARELLKKSIDELRRISHNLMPVSLQHGIKPALEEFCLSFSQVHFHYYGDGSQLSEKMNLLLYRCTFELVNNAIKHSGAENIDVQLVQSAKSITLTVQDDGCGFDINSVKLGAGIENIRSRISEFDGNMEFFSEKGKGAETDIELKIKK
ncbi:hypothetical protein FACS1894178_4640 [Bacteroidia bacterium]|nr:hypothetical protein FACS1894178_4640 [Bacteroidia bacterium]